MYLCSKLDILQGAEIEEAAKKLLIYRKTILEKYKQNKNTIINSDIIMSLREKSVGKNGFFSLLTKKNIFDRKKADEILLIMKYIIRKYEGLLVIDKEIGQILIAIYECLVAPNIINKNISEVSAPFQHCLRKLVES